MKSNCSIPLVFYPARIALLDIALVGVYALFTWAAKGSFPALAAVLAAKLTATGALVQLISRRLLATLGFAALTTAVASASMLLIGLAVIAMFQIPSRSSGVVAVAGFIVVALLAGTGMTLRRGTTPVTS